MGRGGWSRDGNMEYPGGGFMGLQGDAEALCGYQIYTARTKVSPCDG